MTIGTDGLRVERYFRQRFIPYARIKSIQVFGNELRLRVSRRRGSSGKPADRSHLVSITGDRVDMVMAAFRRIQASRALLVAEEAATTMDALDPRGKGVPGWIASLVVLMTKSAGAYRHRAIPVESLLDILARPDVGVGPRIGAAIALKASGHEGAAEHIRAVSGRVASEKVRIALERIAAEEEADLAAVEEALLESGVLEKR